MALPPFQAVLDRYRGDVYRFLAGVAPRADVDDCFQEAFMATLRAYPTLRDGSNIRAWLLTIAYRKAMDAHRAVARGATPVERVPDPANDAAADGRVVWHVVEALPPKQRAAVVQRYLLRAPYAEIATVIGSSEDAARQNVREGLKKLREWLR